MFIWKFFIQLFCSKVFVLHICILHFCYFTIRKGTTNNMFLFLFCDIVSLMWQTCHMSLHDCILDKISLRKLLYISYNNTHFYGTILSASTQYCRDVLAWKYYFLNSTSCFESRTIYILNTVGIGRNFCASTS